MLRGTVDTVLEGTADTAMAGTLGMVMGMVMGMEMGMEMGMVHITETGVMTFNRMGMSLRHLSVNTRGTEMVHTILCRISTLERLGHIRVTAIRERDRRLAFITSSRITTHLGRVVKSGGSLPLPLHLSSSIHG